MFLKLTTVDGPAVINMDRIDYFYAYEDLGEVDGLEEERGSVLFWAGSVKDPVGQNEPNGRTTWVEESLPEILAMLAGGDV